MKKIYLLFVAVALAACSAEPLDDQEITGLDANLVAKSNNKATTQNIEAEFLVPDLICAGEETAFTFGFDDKPGKISLKVQLFGDNPSTEEVEEWYNIFNEQFDGGGPEIFYYTFEESGEYLIRYQIGGGGNTEVSLTVENCGCEESFSYKDNGDGTYTFTYTPEEDVAGALLTFTFPQADVNSTPEVFSQNGSGNDTTFSAALDLSSCVEYLWTFALSTDCKGKGQTEANLWTDFTVNDVSKKGELPTITGNCN